VKIVDAGIVLAALLGIMLGTSAWAENPAKQAGRKSLKTVPALPVTATNAGDVPTAQPAAVPVPAAERSPGAPEDLAPEPVADSLLARGYTLDVGDVARLTVFQQQDMTTEARVSETGSITVPLIGPVQVGGLSARQAEDKIARLLRARGFVREPQVNLSVLQFKSRQVSVLGYVNRPGRYTMEEGVYRITDALALAGGILPGGSDVVALIRVVDGRLQRYELDIPSLLKGTHAGDLPQVRNGDTVYVDRAAQFYIYGEVQRPGNYRLEKDMTLMQALSVGGGLTPRGSRKDIQISRKDAAGRSASTTAQLSDLLKPDDVVYVKDSLF
jgi:polysaccharide export outer membrane protein